MKSPLLIFSFLIVGCASTDYQGFPNREWNMDLPWSDEGYIVELRFPWDEPIGAAYQFRTSPTGNVEGWKRTLSLKGRKEQKKIDSKLAAHILSAFRSFDWSNPLNETNPDEYNIYPDDISVRMKAVTPGSEKDLKIIFLHSSQKTMDLLEEIGILQNENAEQVASRNPDKPVS